MHRFPATIPIDNCVFSAMLDLKTGGEGPPILEARGSQYDSPFQLDCSWLQALPLNFQ